MSRAYVRTTVRNWITAMPKVVPFYETVNKSEDILPADQSGWYTVEFNAENTSTTTYCGDKSETGVIDFVFSTLPGEGDSNLIAGAEQTIDNFMKSVDPNKKLTLIKAMHPEEFTGGDGSKYYMIIIGVEYEYNF
jgi:hypothetical protein